MDESASPDGVHASASSPSALGTNLSSASPSTETATSVAGSSTRTEGPHAGSSTYITSTWTGCPTDTVSRLGIMPCGCTTTSATCTPGSGRPYMTFDTP